MFGAVKVHIYDPPPELTVVGSWIFRGPRWYQWLASKIGIRAWAFVPMREMRIPQPPTAYKMGNVFILTSDQALQLQQKAPDVEAVEPHSTDWGLPRLNALRMPEPEISPFLYSRYLWSGTFGSRQSVIKYGDVS